MNLPSVGETRTFRRTFTVEDVEQFAELSGDTQPRHTEPDEDGRVMVQGLLTATMPTKIGGDLEVLAHTYDTRFRRPVYTGEQITCSFTTTALEERADRFELTVSVECENPDDEVVLEGTIEGIIRKDT